MTEAKNSLDIERDRRYIQHRNILHRSILCMAEKTVENLNRQLRRYYPKATDISMIDTDALILLAES